MVTQIIAKIRAVLQDNSLTSFESYSASGNSFVIAQENATAVNSVTVAGTTISSGEYDYDISSQTVTIDSGSVATGDAVIINFSYYKYSDDELINYIKTAIIYMGDYNYNPIFEVTSGEEDIYPIPDKKEQNLIATIVGILINPDWSSYRTSSIQVVYPNKMTKDEKIEKLVSRFKRTAEGIGGIINLAGNEYGL